MLNFHTLVTLVRMFSENNIEEFDRFDHTLIFRIRIGTKNHSAKFNFRRKFV